MYDIETSGEEILGRLRKKIAAKKRLKKGLTRLKLLKAIKRKTKKTTPKRSVAKKPVLKKLWGRLNPAKRKALMAAAIRKNPKLKAKLAVALVKKRMADRKDGTVTSPGQVDQTPVPATSPTTIMRNPASAPVPTQEAPTDAEMVEDEMNQAPLDNAADADQADAGYLRDLLQQNGLGVSVDRGQRQGIRCQIGRASCRERVCSVV